MQIGNSTHELRKAIILKLPRADIARLTNSARIAASLESKWQSTMRRALDDILRRAIKDLSDDGRINSADYSIEDELTRHWLESMKTGFQVAESDREYKKNPEKKLAINRTPRTLKQIMELWDKWRTKRYVNKAKRAQAKAIKEEYLEKIGDAWKKYSNDFRSGETFNQSEAFKKIREETKATYSRVNTIVNTETTKYYNEARKRVYDTSPDVTHYLFVAIRDSGTTRWCTPKTIDGKRGRHGLVYKKTDPLLKKEKPACHWNCRSELLPLTPHNPVHLKLIEDASIQRRNVQCYPLPAGWSA